MSVGSKPSLGTSLCQPEDYIPVQGSIGQVLLMIPVSISACIDTKEISEPLCCDNLVIW